MTQKVEFIEGEVRFTADYLNQLGQVWNIVPKRGMIKKGQEIKSGQVFAHIESNRCLTPLRAPQGGYVIEWNEELIKNPSVVEPGVWLLKLKEKN